MSYLFQVGMEWGALSAKPPEHPHHLAREPEVRIGRAHLDRLEVFVLGKQEDLVAAREVALHGRLVADHGHRDLAGADGSLVVHDDDVAVQDPRVLHAVPPHAEREMLAGPHERAVYDEHVLNVLFGENRRAGGHAAQQWNFDCVARGGARVFGYGAGRGGCARVPAGGGRLRPAQLDAAGGPSVAADLPRLLEAVEVVPHTVRRGDPEGLPDFTNCGRSALLAEGSRDHVEDRLVAVRASLHSGEPLGLTLPGAPRRLGQIGLAHDMRIVHICAVVKSGLNGPALKERFPRTRAMP